MAGCAMNEAVMAIPVDFSSEQRADLREAAHRAGICIKSFVSEPTAAYVKAPPHNSAARLAMPFPPSAACKFLDLPPVNLRNLHLHLTKNSFASRPPHLCGVTLNVGMNWLGQAMSLFSTGAAAHWTSA